MIAALASFIFLLFHSNEKTINMSFIGIFLLK